jgi:DNA topoisomerase-1
MSKTLVIVESPAKCKKIQSYLGNNYIVKSSFGHLSNLRGKNQGVNIENQYELVFDVSKGKQLNELKSAMKSCNKVILASDEDREGEAIAYHVAKLLKVDLKEKNRITFHEITKNAILKAIENPRTIDLNMVNAQKARQGLDYLVGFNLSPLLWKSIQNGLSAGRVQSIAVKLIVEKENIIDEFQESNYYYILGYFNKNIIGVLSEKFQEKNDVMQFLEDCKTSIFKITDITKKKVTNNPSPPFITTTIQMEAGRKFGLSAKVIMSNLQKLYEDGKITYHRTDSVILSNDCKAQISKYVNEHYGPEYLKLKNFKNKSKNSQEAHEAIRPTNINLTHLEGNGVIQKIYRLIWLRTVASQMSPCILNRMEITINISKRVKETFKAKTEKIIFDGFRKIYEGYKEVNEEDKITDLEGKVEIDELLENDKIECNEKYKNQPPRYSEATLIKKMEELEIGRPSTYANIMATIQERGYVEKKNIEGIKKDCCIITLQNKKITEKNIKMVINKEKNKLIPTDTGKITTTYLNNHFENIMDYQFTSNIENQLDEIVQNKNQYFNVMDTFYKTIKDKLDDCNQNAKDNKTKLYKTDKKLLGQLNGRNMYVYKARYGPVIQIGEDKEKTKYYVAIEDLDISYEEALTKCVYPKNIGNHNGKDIFVKKGKYGFYLEYNKKNYKIKNGFDENIELNQALECINEIDNNIIKKIGKYIIKNGEYGLYVQSGKTLRGIPKNIDINDIDEKYLKDLLDKPPPKKYVKSNFSKSKTKK